MFEQYIKLFNIEWLPLWLVEGLAIMFGAIILMMLLCKANDLINRD